MMERSKKLFCTFVICISLFGGLFTFAEEGVEVEVKPYHYDLLFETTEAHFQDYNESQKEPLRFSGRVAVKFKFVNEVKDEFFFSLNVHSKTNVSDVKFYGNLNETVEEIKNFTHIIENGYLKINCHNFNKTFQSYVLNVHFSNEFGKDMSGFYRSSYEVDGKNRWLLTTHFEPIFARKAFPCFDQPALKAYFQVTISFPKSLKDYYVLSNAPCPKGEENNNFKVVKCSTTSIPMSTYLVAFTVSDFAQTKTVSFKSNYPPEHSEKLRSLTTYGRKSTIDRGDAELSQIAGKDAVEALSEYLGKGYAFEKVDQVGIPDFSAGAMENWGLILFREKALFFNNENGTVAVKQSNVLTITHELVHQWFGNLVTLASWDYIWLNEAFATYISHVIANKLTNVKSGDWQYLNQMLVREVHSKAFETDGLAAAKAMSHEIKNESIIAGSFNDIPYAKGGSVLRMWDLSLKRGDFQESLKHYIEKNAQSATTPEDLYKSFKEKAQMEEKFFKTWHETPGYPVVHVNKKNGTLYELTQNRFLWENSSKRNEEYFIPITYHEPNTLNFSTQSFMWLEKSLTLNITSKWFVLNNQQAGYYRVNYDYELWNALAEALKKNHTDIHELNRAQLVNDVFSLARSVQKNYVNYSTAFYVTEYLKNEKSYVVWHTAFRSFEFVLYKLSHDKEESDKLKNHVLKLLEPHFTAFNSTSEKHVDRLKAALMAKWACTLNHEKCVSQAKDLYPRAKEYPDTEEVILCTVVRHNSKAWDEVFELYKKEVDSSRKIMYLTVLGCTGNKTVAEMYLNKTLSPEFHIREQDLTFALSSVYNGAPDNVEVAFEFVENNFETIASKFGGINPLGRAVEGISLRLHKDVFITRMESLTQKIKESKIPNVLPESLDSALSVLKSNKNWYEVKVPQIKKYLNSSSSLSYSFILTAFCSILISRI